MDHVTLPNLMGALEAVYQNLRIPDILPFSFNLHGDMSQDELDSALSMGNLLRCSRCLDPGVM